MSTLTHSYPFQAQSLPLRAKTAARRRTVTVFPAPLWRQGVGVTVVRRRVEYFFCLLLVLCAAAAVIYSSLVMWGTFHGEAFSHAVGQIAGGAAR